MLLLEKTVFYYLNLCGRHGVPYMLACVCIHFVQRKKYYLQKMLCENGGHFISRKNEKTSCIYK
ncbi:hypothetical protein NQ314_007938 [Rhamnusium bicolor]|uniref:Uncharacterized protein n=1 Tax=Rhamnusium bicolor TaxID=1586634 RepID=A0AAV8YGU0_9CUCU|nr:hypothetical protein NQ314_007938 [Rhamnusium bicolor]